MDAIALQGVWINSPSGGATTKRFKYRFPNTFNRFWRDYNFPNSYMSWAHTEGITLNKLNYSPGGGVVTATSISDSYRGIPTQKELAPTGGTYQGAEVIFRIPGTLLDPITPLPADQIVDEDGVIYSVLWVHKVLLTEEWRCFVIDLSIYLPDSINIERPTYTRDRFKLDQPFWNTIYTNLPSRAQPNTLNIGVEGGVATEITTLELIISQQVDIQSNDRVLYNNNYYNIQSYDKGLRITDFPVLHIRSQN